MAGRGGERASVTPVAGTPRGCQATPASCMAPASIPTPASASSSAAAAWRARMLVGSSCSRLAPHTTGDSVPRLTGRGDQIECATRGGAQGAGGAAVARGAGRTSARARSGRPPAAASARRVGWLAPGRRRRRCLGLIRPTCACLGGRWRAGRRRGGRTACASGLLQSPHPARMTAAVIAPTPQGCCSRSKVAEAAAGERRAAPRRATQRARGAARGGRRPAGPPRAIAHGTAASCRVGCGPHLPLQ